MKVLFIGLGSAGQRHLRNLKRLLGNDVELMAYRVRRLSRVLDDNLNVVAGQTLAEAYQIREFYDLQEALTEKPDIVVISNPNSMHIACAIEAAKAGADLFIEKPLSDSLAHIRELEQITREKRLKVYIGFQNRLHPCIHKLREICESGVLGNIVSIHCEIGELLTRMHRYEDYRGMNEAQKTTGGGVVLCQIHELDYLYWLFGLPSEVYAIGGRNSHLEIDVEDHATSLCRFSQNGNIFSAIIHQDFVQFPPTRRCKVIGEYGRVEIDLIKNTAAVALQDQDPVFYQFDTFKRNDMFYKEMELFLDCVRTRKKEFVGLSDGLGSLRFALAIKESMEKHKIIRMEEMEYE